MLFTFIRNKEKVSDRKVFITVGEETERMREVFHRNENCHCGEGYTRSHRPILSYLFHCHLHQRLSLQKKENVLTSFLHAFHFYLCPFLSGCIRRLLPNVKYFSEKKLMPEHAKIKLKSIP